MSTPTISCRGCANLVSLLSASTATKRKRVDAAEWKRRVTRALDLSRVFIDELTSQLNKEMDAEVDEDTPASASIDGLIGQLDAPAAATETPAAAAETPAETSNLEAPAAVDCHSQPQDDDDAADDEIPSTQA